MVFILMIPFDFTTEPRNPKIYKSLKFEFFMEENKFDYEKKILKFWDENQIYEKVKKKNEGLKPFNHIDGPPYPTGDPHLGHLRNWAVKDSVLRFKRFEGYDVYARDGYDVHGLPVENKVQNKLGLKTVAELKEYGEDNFVKECKKYVSEIIDDMTGVRKRFGLWMDRDYYHTSNPEYLSLSWRFFKMAHEKGLLYKDYKTVAWCPHDETTLSDYEIKDTYKTIEDPSIYVRFRVKKEFCKTPYPEYFVIWTTTPWTLQSNMAIAVNPNFEYSRVLVDINGKEEVLILAKNLAKKVIDILSKSIDIKFVEILNSELGSEFEGIKYEHFYIDDTPSQKDFLNNGHKNIHSIVLADYVTLGAEEDIFEKLEKRGYKHSNKQDELEQLEIEKAVYEQDAETKSEGTGLVHIAPGHGFDDYEVGRRYNLPIFCPVGPDGKFTEGKYKNLYFKDVDSIAIDYLKNKGFLLHSEKKTHRYPCCWRCKTPIVYRAADQWWIRRSSFKNNIIKENSNVKWFPKFAKTSFDNLMGNVGDWPISRQRYWGIPLPIFEDEDGNYEVFGSKEELEQRVGVKLEDIHRDNLKGIVIKNKVSGKDMKAVPFITDVWFESGCASFASHHGEGLSFDEILKKYYPIKWVTEGEDQIRGWFSSLFSVGYVLTGKAPYNEVLFQKFIMDREGQKMSKSLGNGITGTESINTWGADAVRFYLLKKRAPDEQINFDPEEFSIVNGFFNTFNNVVKYMNSYLNEYSLKDDFFDITGLSVEDKWILYKLSKSIDAFRLHFDNYRINLAYDVLEDFIVRDLSKTYLKLIKERAEERDNFLLCIFVKILRQTLVMLSTAAPFVSEKLYGEICIPQKKESVFLENFPEVDLLLVKQVERMGIDENFSLAQDILQAILNAREKAKIGVRWPLEKIDIGSSDNLASKLKPFEILLKKLANIQKINYDLSEVEMNYIIKPNFANIKRDFKDPSVAIKVINLNKFYIAQDLKMSEVGGVYEGVEIVFDKHVIKEVELKGELTSSEFGRGFVILHTHQDEILLEEGYLREVMRRIQQARKELGLKKQDKIKLSFDGSDDYIVELSSNWSGVISKKVGAVEILQNELENKFEEKIKDKVLRFSIEG